MGTTTDSNAPGPSTARHVGLNARTGAELFTLKDTSNAVRAIAITAAQQAARVYGMQAARLARRNGASTGTTVMGRTPARSFARRPERIVL